MKKHTTEGYIYDTEPKFYRVYDAYKDWKTNGRERYVLENHIVLYKSKGASNESVKVRVTIEELV